MKKNSIITSLTAAAVMLPALNHASLPVTQTVSTNQQDVKKSTPPVLKKTSALSMNTTNDSPMLCVAPYLKKILDLKTIQIFMLNDCPEKTNDSASDATALLATGADSEKLVEEGSSVSEKLDEDTASDTTSMSEKLEEDGGATSETVTDPENPKADEASADAATDSEYDPHAIFGADSKVFTRVMHPVKNLFADVALALTKITHNNKQYNLIPLRPDPMIDVNAVNAYLEIPFTGKMDFKVAVGRDALTSASPIFYTVTGASPGVVAPDTGSARQAVTGASVRDQRNEGAVSLNYYGEKATTKVEVGASREYDYKSNFIGGETNIDFNNKNTALNLGTSYTSNDVIPNQLGAITPRVGGTNSNWQLMGGITQIINTKSLAQFAITYFLDNGFMNDPYKPDYLPNKRVGWSFAGKYVHYISSFHEAGLNLEYRYYTDDWGVNSSTMKTTLRMDLTNGWGLEPGIRYYSQNGTRFYNLLTPPNVTPQSTFLYYTSDYRFASYGQLSGLLEVDKQLSASNTMYVGGSYGARNASMRLGGAKVTYPTESEFTKIRMAVIYVGIKGVY
ncbi:TPA: DUF3570 domain-containing protein [Legionella pneumophila]|nr:DUF3570 domain-containing protein [Legionella pneumophila]